MAGKNKNFEYFVSGVFENADGKVFHFRTQTMTNQNWFCKVNSASALKDWEEKYCKFWNCKTCSVLYYHELK